MVQWYFPVIKINDILAVILKTNLGLETYIKIYQNILAMYFVNFAQLIIASQQRPADGQIFLRKKGYVNFIMNIDCRWISLFIRMHITFKYKESVPAKFLYQTKCLKIKEIMPWKNVETLKENSVFLFSFKSSHTVPSINPYVYVYTPPGILFIYMYTYFLLFVSFFVCTRPPRPPRNFLFWY